LLVLHIKEYTYLLPWLTTALDEVKMAATMENGGISLILLNCDGEPISSGDDNTQRIVVG